MTITSRFNALTVACGICLALLCTSAPAAFEYSFSSETDVAQGTTVPIDFILTVTGETDPTFETATARILGANASGEIIGSLGSVATISFAPSGGALGSSTKLVFAPSYTAGSIGSSVTTQGTLFTLNVDVPGSAQAGEVFTLSPDFVGPFRTKIDLGGSEVVPTVGDISGIAGTITVAVPEPSSMLCLVGLGAACGFVRRRRA